MTRDKAQRAQSTFKAFLASSPALARDILKWDIDQEDRRADVNCMMTDGSCLDFQLVGWLEAGQMRESLRRDSAEKDIVGRLLKHYPQPLPHLQPAVVEPKPDARSPSADHLARIVKEFGDLIAEASEEWPRHPEWNSPQGYLCRDLRKWPSLDSYLSEVHFNVYGPDPAWIMFPLHGGAYAPARSLKVLYEAVGKKAAHYGPPNATIPLDLIVH
jgi:hypothetical protein